jgi:tripeptide aminopeptidase
MTSLSPPSRERLTELFLMLTRIPSPSGRERQVADAIIACLEVLGLQVHEDGTGTTIGGDTGNLWCTVAGGAAAGAGASGSTSALRGGAASDAGSAQMGGAGPYLALGAHMDTVMPTNSLEPVLGEDGVFRNTRDTILGSDDKAAIAALLHATELLKASGEPFPSYELFFTVSEENGLVGAKHLAEDALTSPLAVVMDSSGSVGGIVCKAPSRHGLRATFRGQAAHAGLEPERGRSAIQAAARAIDAMKLGRLDAETTANVGVISGGVASNIVPAECVIEGECRGHDEERLAGVAAAMVDAVQEAAAHFGVDVDISLVHEFPAFALNGRSAAVRLGKAAVTVMGLEPILLTAGGGSDANILNARGLPTINLDAGMMRVHSPEEYLALDELERLCSLALQLIRLAPEYAPRPKSSGGRS